MIAQYFSLKRSKVAQRNETNERTELFEHSQASSVSLKADYNSFFTGIFQNNKFFNFRYIAETHFFQIHEIKMGFSMLVLVQILSWCTGKDKANIHFKTMLPMCVR